MSVTAVDIANLAISKCGSERITSLAENSKQARAVSAAYNLILEAELQTNAWRFAIRRKRLIAGAAPDWGRMYSFPLPDDFVRLLPRYPERNYLPPDWLIEGTHLVTNAADGQGTAAGNVRLALQTNADITTDLEAGDTLDGETLVAGDLVLLMGQTNPAQNGVYEVPASGAASRKGELRFGYYWQVEEGTLANRTFALATNEPFTVGTTDLTFVETSGKPDILDIRYVGLHDDADTMSPLFRLAFACHLAWHIVEELTNSNTKKDALVAEYLDTVREARRVNAIEKPAQTPAPDGFVTVQSIGFDTFPNA